MPPDSCTKPKRRFTFVLPNAWKISCRIDRLLLKHMWLCSSSPVSALPLKQCTYPQSMLSLLAFLFIVPEFQKLQQSNITSSGWETNAQKTIESAGQRMQYSFLALHSTTWYCGLRQGRCLHWKQPSTKTDNTNPGMIQEWSRLPCVTFASMLPGTAMPVLQETLKKGNRSTVSQRPHLHELPSHRKIKDRPVSWVMLWCELRSLVGQFT